MKTMTERLLGPLIGSQFDAFGCKKRGAHTDDAERDGCFPCAVESGTVDNPDDVVALVDDRGSSSELTGGFGTPWEHTRFYKSGVGLHREKGPAIESDLLRAWFVDGLCHRTDGPAIEWNGQYAWFTEGRLHRIGAPAVNTDRGTEWRVDGKLHREDGPAASTVPAWPPHGAAKPELWHDFALQGARVSRQVVWKEWVANHTTIERTNWYAIEHLDSTINDGQPADAPFLPIDASAAELALILFPSGDELAEETPPVATRPAADAADPCRIPAEPLDEFTARITPERLLPSKTVRRVLPYDAAAFRRRIAHADRLGTLRRSAPDVRSTWIELLRRDGPLHTGDYVSADLEIDADMVAYGVERMALNQIFDDEAIETYKEFGGDLPPATARYWLASTAHKHAERLALAYAAHGGFVEVRGRLAPLKSISCDIERAFEFAAQAIAAGVNDIVAKSWASAIVVASGYPKVSLRWGGSQTLDATYSRSVPMPSLASDYYAKALEDLRERADATRFMNYVSRCYGSTGKALSDW